MSEWQRRESRQCGAEPASFRVVRLRERPLQPLTMVANTCLDLVRLGSRLLLQETQHGVGLIVFLFAAAIGGSALADTAVPSKDVSGSDLPWLKRYAGSVILDFSQSAFDEADLVSGPLKPKDGLDPVSNNLLRTPESVTTLKGRRTRFVYPRNAFDRATAPFK